MRRPAPESVIRVGTMCNIPGGRRGIPGCAISVLEHLDPSRFEGTVWLPWSEPDACPKPVRLAVPSLVFRAASKLGVPTDAFQPITEQRFLASLPRSSLVWVFPAWTPRIIETVKARGHTLLLERINSEASHARAILSEAERRLDLPSFHGIDERGVEREAWECETADFVFVCSPFVERSFLAAGVPQHKLIRCSYGWDPAAYPMAPRTDHGHERPLFLFVGSGCVRKGLPDLLAHWRRLAPPARLRIVGPIDAPIRERYADVLQRPEVEVFGYDVNLTRHYEEAHVFVLPSLEEGSPLVTYLALGAGLPCLTSLAGAGGIVEDDIEGLVRDPLDEASFEAALMQLATDAALRERLGTAARLTAMRYTWERVALDRGEVFAKAAQGALSGVPAASGPALSAAST